MDEETDSGAPLIALIILFIGAVFITVGAVFLTYGLYVLIRTGSWPHYPLAKLVAEVGFPLPQSGEGPLAWILAQSACVVLLSIGAVITGGGAWLIARYHRHRRVTAAAADAAIV
jgi:hypothetical protein